MKGLSFAAAMLAFALGAAPACADPLDRANEAVRNATDEELRAEFQRRFDERKHPPATTRSLVVARGGDAPPLSGIDESDLVTAARAQYRTIYGPKDTRMDFYSIPEGDVKALARASVALFQVEKTIASGGKVALKTKLLRDEMRLCANEKFDTQPSGAFCSGTLVGPDRVLTAGHCIHEISKDDEIGPLAKVKFVFGYWMENGNSASAELPSEQVFTGQEVLRGEMNETRDWALVRLDRPVPEAIAKPVTDWARDPVQVGQGVFVIGYPSGIPLKYAPGAHVRDISNPGFFVANLNSFGGNSGSGVYDQATNKLVGVLVRGDTDYLEDKARKCWRVHYCPKNGCRGEDVTRISVVQAPQVATRN